jgi:AcrR family transcriptional regulator
MNMKTVNRAFRARAPGRPREFDMDEALDKAVHVFRERGFNATSISDLADAMGLVTGSIYKAFKDKRAVFLAAYDRYAFTRDLQLQKIFRLDKPGKEKIRDFLKLYVDVSYGIDGRRGCLVVASAIELATYDSEVAKRVKDSLSTTEEQIIALILEGQKDGSIPLNIDPEVAARFMLCFFQGLRVVGKTGPASKDMKHAADLAMIVFS